MILSQELFGFAYGLVKGWPLSVSACAFCDGLRAGILAWNLMNCDVDMKQMTEIFVN